MSNLNFELECNDEIVNMFYYLRPLLFSKFQKATVFWNTFAIQ